MIGVFIYFIWVARGKGIWRENFVLPILELEGQVVSTK